MHGVKFLGSLGLKGNLLSAVPIVIPRLLGVPTVSFTQTYGPFVNHLPRITAKITLGYANFLFAREPESIHNLASIGLEPRARLFPDVAMTLAPADLDQLACSNDVKNFVLSDEPYIGISLSIMVVRQEERLGYPSRYKDLITNFIQSLLDQSHRVLLIPHTHKPNNPADDDLGLTLQVFEKLSVNCGQCLVVQDDLPPDQLKTLIAASHIFIGSRYHSLVASLSTGVPSISIGWCHKYDGLLSLFDMKQFSFGSDHVKLDTLQFAVSDLVSNRQQYSELIELRLAPIQEQVSESIKLVASLV